MATVAFHAVVALPLIWLGSDLFRHHAQARLAPADTSGVSLMEGEYVKLGETPVPTPSSALRKTHAADDRNLRHLPKPTIAQMPVSRLHLRLLYRHPLWSRSREGEARTCAREERPVSTFAELEALAAKAKREAETQQRINQRVSFGKSTWGKANEILDRPTAMLVGSPGQASPASAPCRTHA